MKVIDVKTYLVGTRSQWTYVFVQVYTDEGITGLGESGMCYGTGSLSMPGIIEQLKRFVVGQDPFDIESIWANMFNRSFWAPGGGPHITSGISAIEMALWDIVGKALKTPVYKLLGGACQKKIRVYANDWFANPAKPCRTPEDYAREARRVVEDGFTALKFDAFPQAQRLSTRQEEEVISKYTAVREAVGDKIDILVEVHGKLDTNTAIRMGKKLERLNPLFYEEPIPMGNPKALAKVAREVDIPIAAGERLYTRHGFREYLERGAIEIIQPDVGTSGGILEVSKKIASMADAYFVPVAPHNPCGPIQTAATMQVDACMPNFLIQEFIPYTESPREPNILFSSVDRAYEVDYWKRKDGFVELIDRPGLGIELKEDELAKHLLD